MRAFVLILCVFLCALTAFAAVPQPNVPDSNSPAQAKAFVITCSGMIDHGLFESVKRRSEQALAAGATHLIFQISTYGGLVKSADDISKYLILELGPRTHTAAFVKTEAISAGAMISVSCEDILMKPNTTIGDCAPIQQGQKLEGVEREKVESFIRATFQRAAGANKYPAALLEAMVSRHKKVYRVENISTGGYEFFEAEKLPPDANSYALAEKELIISDNEILTLTAEEAEKYNIARAVTADIEQVLSFFEKRDGLNFSEQITTLEPNWSEQLVRKLNHPSFTGILFMVGLLGLYVEFKTPGLGLPGLVAVICFSVMFGSRFLVGLANWWEVGLFGLGIVLLLIEIFIIPGFGIAGLSGIFCILVGFFAILVPNRPDELPWPKHDLGNIQWQMFEKGAWAFSLGFVGFVIVAYFLAKLLPKTSVFSGLLLEPARPGDKMTPVSTAPPGPQGTDISLGDEGAALTKLRPAGQARFGRSIVDVVAQGVFIDKDQKIKVTQIQGNRVVVDTINETKL